MVRKKVVKKPARPATPAQLARNKIGSLILSKASDEAIADARRALAYIVLEGHIQTALDAGVKHGQVAYIAKKLAGAK